MASLTGKLADPEFRKERASKGGTARTTTDHYIAALEGRTQELTPEHKARIKRIADGIPLTDEQLSKLAVLLQPERTP